MNIAVAKTSLATQNGTIRPQVRIVIVGHVDHGKSTLVGRLLHGYALSFTANSVFGRSAGIALTFVALLVAGALCLLSGMQGLQDQGEGVTKT